MEGWEGVGGQARPAVTLIRAIAAAALRKQRTLPSVHSRPPSRYALAPAAAAHWTAAARASIEPVRWPRTYIPVYHTPSSVVATAPPPPSDNDRRRGLELRTAAEPCKRRGLSELRRQAASTTVGGASGAELPGRWAYLHLGLDHWRSYKWAELRQPHSLFACKDGVMGLIDRLGQYFRSLTESGGGRRRCQAPV